MKLKDLKTEISPRRPGGKLVLAVAVAAATALWVQYKAKKAERDNPPAGKFVEAAGVRLHYVERGDGPPVVLLHGNGMLAQDFLGSSLVDLLVARHRVIVFDRPGYGYSERPRTRLWTPTAQAAVLHEACDKLGVKRPVVVGHSWGAMVAAAWALDFSADVSGLVLLSGYYYPTLRPDVALFAPPAIPILGDVMRYTLSPLAMRASLPMMLKTMFAPCPVDPGFEAVVPKELLLRPIQIRASAEEAALAIPAALGLKDRYCELRVPVRIFAGDKDMVVFIDRHSMRLHQEIPGSTLTIVPGVGHMVHHFASWKIAGAVDEIHSADKGSRQSPFDLQRVEFREEVEALRA